MQQKVDWILKKLTGMKSVDPRLATQSRRTYLANKERARQFIEQRLDLVNQKYGFQYNRISVRNQKTRWGSCSKDGNLNFNYKIIFLPQRVADYIIVHELCHLKEMNHSKRFWGLVAESFPDYKKLKKELTRSGLGGC